MLLVGLCIVKKKCSMFFQEFFFSTFYFVDFFILRHIKTKLKFPDLLSKNQGPSSNGAKKKNNQMAKHKVYANKVTIELSILKGLTFGEPLSLCGGRERERGYQPKKTFISEPDSNEQLLLSIFMTNYIHMWNERQQRATHQEKTRKQKQKTNCVHISSRHVVIPIRVP